MKELIYIKGSLADKITYFLMMAFIISLPFDRFYSELSLIGLCIHTAIHYKKGSFVSISWKSTILTCSIFILTIIATIYTNYLDEAFFEWERQLAMILFPLIFIFNSFDFSHYKMNFIYGLACSCAITILYLYYSAFSIIQFNHLPLSAIFSNAFINHHFSAPIDMHATYFSMYIALAAVGALYRLITDDNFKFKLLYGIIFMILVLGLLQLSSRAVLIAFAIICNLVLPFMLLKHKKRIYFLVGSMFISLMVLFAVTQMENLKTRIITELHDDLTESTINLNLLEPRIKRWASAWKLIKSSPIYGYGSGSEVALLKELYFKEKLFNSYLNDLNAHNQYLSIMIKTGIFGLCILLYLFYSGFKFAFRKNDVMFASFLIILTIVSFSENVLDANKGIFFFAFCFNLFYLDSFLINCKKNNLHVV